MPIYGSKFRNLEGQKNEQLFDISKISTLRPSKRPIGHVFKNPYQGKLNTLGCTYGLILGQMGQFRVPFKASQMSWKMPFFFAMAPGTP